jgi:Domain of unknown function (DUF5666)
MSRRLFQLYCGAFVCCFFPILANSEDSIVIDCISVKEDNQQFKWRTAGYSDCRTLILSDKTQLNRGKNPLTPETLKDGQWLSVQGKKSNDTFFAKRAELLDHYDGSIDGIMEVHPLRLSVKRKDVMLLVQLEEETIVTKGKTVISPNTFRLGDIVTVVGTHQSKSFLAKRIIIKPAK